MIVWCKGCKTEAIEVRPDNVESESSVCWSCYPYYHLAQVNSWRGSYPTPPEHFAPKSWKISWEKDGVLHTDVVPAQQGYTLTDIAKLWQNLWAARDDRVYGPSPNIVLSEN